VARVRIAIRTARFGVIEDSDQSISTRVEGINGVDPFSLPKSLASLPGFEIESDLMM
jgi:hypothetical protein